MAKPVNAKKTLGLTALVSALTWSMVVSNADAATVVFTNRTAFENALSSSTTDNLNNLLQSWQDSYVGPGFTMTSDLLYGCVVDGCGTNPGFVYPAYLWTYSQNPVTFSFSSPVTALGFDYANAEGSSGVKPILGGITAPTESGFFGLISDDPFSSILLGQTGNFLILDNVTFGMSATATPLPAALPLFATVLAGGGLIAWRRKRKAAKLA